MSSTFTERSPVSLLDTGDPGWDQHISRAVLKIVSSGEATLNSVADETRNAMRCEYLKLESASGERVVFGPEEIQRSIRMQEPGPPGKPVEAMSQDWKYFCLSCALPGGGSMVAAWRASEALPKSLPMIMKAFAGLAALTAFYGIFATIFTVMFGSNVPLIGLALIILCELPRLVLWTADRERQAPGLPCPQQAIGLSIFVHLGLCAAVASIATTPFGKDGVFAPQPQTPPTATQAFLWWGFWFHLFQTTAIATNALLTAWLQTAWEQYPASARYLCERRMAEAVQAFLFWGPLLLAALAVICFRRQPGISWLAIGFASICLGILAWSTVLLRARFSERRTASTAPAA